jgi:tetratricopeptide (TPR) repeat protein
LLMYLSEAYIVAHRLDEALESAGRALSFSCERGQRPYEAQALWLLGEVTALRDRPEHADRHYHDALVLAEKLELRPLAAHCHFGLGKLWRRRAMRSEAQAHLTMATTMYREMGMTSWLERAEGELREVR